MKYYLTFLLLFTVNLGFSQAAKHTISGYIKEEGSGELLPGVTIYVPELKSGAASNTYGFYSLTVAEGTHTLQYSFVGYETVVKKVDLTKNTQIDIFLEPAVTALQEVVVRADQVEKESDKAQMSVMKIQAKQIQDFPAFMGEKDVLKVLQLMPGVQSGAEGNTGLYVRGGGPDQNLLILDEAPVYNASHLFGFFSVFNGDALKSVELYKGGFPARFGGRLSSVIKMDMKDGNKEQVHGKVGVGILSSSLMLEGPLSKGKTSFILSGRRTYLDLLTQPFLPVEAKGGYYFYDLNTKVNHEFSSKDKLYLSGYFGQDRFYFREKYDNGYGFKAGLSWGNATGTLRWNHQFSEKLFSNTSLIFSNYSFLIDAEEEDNDYTYTLEYSSGIRDYGAKLDFDYFPSPNHSLKFGFASTYHSYTPSAFVQEETGIIPINEKESFNSVESALYLEDEMRFFNKLNILAGIRWSSFYYKAASYFKPEPRLSMAYMLGEDFSVKASYAAMNQYIHLLTSSGIGLPTDLWVSSTDRVKPQSSQQVALGVSKDILGNQYNLSLEGYFKKSEDVISYKEGASFLVLDDPESGRDLDWQDNITAGQAWAYGVEAFLQKKLGEFTGWLGYTLSWSEQQFDELNGGEKFFAKYDRRHDASLVGIYKPHEKITLSGSWVYGTGNNFTLPTGTFKTISHNLLGLSYTPSEFNQIERRNNFRAEAYHRLDLSIQMHKKKKRGMRTWEFSLYNAYSRKNPFFYFTESTNDFGSNTQEVKLKRISIFPILPSFKYTFEF